MSVDARLLDEVAGLAKLVVEPHERATLLVQFAAIVRLVDDLDDATTDAIPPDDDDALRLAADQPESFDATEAMAESAGWTPNGVAVPRVMGRPGASADEPIEGEVP